MPVTPFHCGVGLAAKGAAPARFSFLIFCATQIAIDFESGYHIFLGEYPVHRGMHTVLGASLVSLAVAFLLRRVLPSAQISSRTALVSAAVSMLGHVVPDAIMHEDVRPFAPFSDANPLHGVISIAALHGALVVVGAAGLALWAVRRRST